MSPLGTSTRAGRGKRRAQPTAPAEPGAPPPSLFKRTRSVTAVAILLCIACFAAYLPVLDNGFVNYDDDHYLTQNPSLRLGLSWEGIAWAFTTRFGANWFPLTWLSFLLDYEIYGLDPRGFHLTNLLLHVASVVLLFLAFVWMTGAPGKSAFVAGVFALHPLHVESVAWAATRKDVLSGFLGMLTLAAYLRYGERRSLGRYLPVALFLALGLMAKPMLVSFPFVLLLLDWWPLGRLRDRTSLKQVLLEKIPLFILVAASSIVTYWAQQTSGAVQPLERFPFAVRFWNALISYWRYLGKTFWPEGLAVYYPHPGNAVSVGWGLVAGLSLLMVSLLILKAARSRPYLAVGWLWYVGTLVPVIGLVQVGEQAMADRYTYLPLIGISVILAWGLTDLVAGRTGKRLLAVAAPVALALSAVATFYQTRLWRDSVSLFEHALRVTRENALAQINLGVALLNLGRYPEATSHLKEAVRIHPGSAEAHAALGVVETREQGWEAANQHFSTALRLDPTSARVHAAYGELLLRQGEVGEALRHFREAVAVEPTYAEAHNHLAAGLIAQGKPEEALSELGMALALRPDFAEALYNTGVALAGQEKQTEAIEYFRRAAAARPGYGQAHLGWGLALFDRKDYEEAAGRFREAASLLPDDPQPRYRWGLALAQLKRFEEALTRFGEAVSLSPDFAEAHYSLGLTLANLGRFPQSLPHFQKAVSLSPDYPEAHLGWGMALGSLGNFAGSLAHFERALALRPNFPEAQNHWGMALARLGRPAEAAARLRAAIALNPGYADAHNNLGILLAQQGKLAEAAESFRAAVRFAPDHPNARTNLEKTLAALNH